MKYPFDEIIIIYNPNSTGDSEDNAKTLRAELKKRLKSVKIETVPTKRAGHAIELGEKYAKQGKKRLLLSSSGDGGYNELVNGVLKVKSTKVATAVIPSGNANDHHRATAEGDLADRIVRGKTKYIDVLQIEATVDGKPWQRYAHSYIGLGLTAYIGKKLMKHPVGAMKEKWLVAKYFIRFGHIAAKLDGQRKWRRYSSIIFGNINTMSKIMSLDEKAKIDDGKMEIYITRQLSNFKLFLTLLKGAVWSLEAEKRVKSFHVDLRRSYDIQCDGEVFSIDSGELSVQSASRLLRVLDQ